MQKVILSLGEALGYQFVALVLLLFGARKSLWPLAEKWFEGRVRASVEKGLLEHKAALDKDLERHRDELSREADRHRSRLSRDATDFALWAERRHNATAALFADLLRSEESATTFYDIAIPQLDRIDEVRFSEYLSHLSLTGNERDFLEMDFQAGAFVDAEAKLQPLVERERINRVVRARNAAYEAYFAATLYLSPAVEKAALHVRDYFHEMVVEHQAPVNGRPPLPLLKNQLRFRMLELQNAMRADLARGDG